MSILERWIQEKELFLFDFDGLLVDTERLHFEAYQKMCRARGFTLPWSFTEYASLAHTGSDHVKMSVYELFPQLKLQEPNWFVLHKEKQEAFLEILEKKGASLMPGVEMILNHLDKNGVPFCVVTHSPSSLTKAIRHFHKVFDTVSFWVTREMYENPKPFPDSYLKAVELHGCLQKDCVGFEDTYRGWQALQAAEIESCVVSSLLSDQVKHSIKETKSYCFNSFIDLL